MKRTVSGVIEHAGAGGSGGARWDLILFLSPWREGDGPLQRKALRLTVPSGDQRAAERAMNFWDRRRGQTVRVTLTKFEPPSRRLPYGWVVGKLPIEKIKPDDALDAEQRRLAKPRRVADPVLGRLTLERANSWFSSRRRTRAGSHFLYVEVTDPDDEARVAKAIAAARTIVKRIDRDLLRLRQAIARKMLPLYNRRWRADRRPLTPARFVAALRLRELLIAPRRTTAMFGCGDLFGDHAIELRLSSSGRVSAVLLA